MAEYISTRGGEQVGASQAVLDGIGTYGGLYVPVELQPLDTDWSALKNMAYEDVQKMVRRAMLTDYTEEELQEVCENLNGAFDAETPVVLRQSGDDCLAELFHGPTLSARDYGTLMLPKLITFGGRKNGLKEKLAVLSASEGDQGAAVFHAFSGMPGMEVLVYSPKEGVTAVQEKLTAVQEGFNLHGAGVRAGEPDTQLNVRELLNNVEYQEKLTNNGFRFSTAGTGNIGVIAAYVGNLFFIYGQMVNASRIQAGDAITLSIPTGSMAEAMAAVYAKKLGLPVGKIVLACNENSILPEFMESGSYDADVEFTETLTPSMNVADPTNLERLLYELTGGDTSAVANYMNSIQWMGGYDIADEQKEQMNEWFFCTSVSDEEAEAEMKRAYDNGGNILDPHAAAASTALHTYQQESGDQTPAVILGTVSPLKTAEIVLNAIGEPESDPAAAVEKLAGLMGAEEPDALNGLFQKDSVHNKAINAEDVMSETTAILQLM